MKRLSKAQETSVDDLIGDVRDNERKLVEAHAEMSAAVDNYNDAVAEYNAAATAVQEFRDEVVGDMEAYRDDRSERWQEGDAGQAYQAWIDEWQGLEAEGVEVAECPDDPSSDFFADNFCYEPEPCA